MPRPVVKDVVDQIEWEPAMPGLCFYDCHFKVQHLKAATHLIWQTGALSPDSFWGDRIFNKSLPRGRRRVNCWKLNVQIFVYSRQVALQPKLK